MSSRNQIELNPAVILGVGPLGIDVVNGLERRLLASDFQEKPVFATLCVPSLGDASGSWLRFCGKPKPCPEPNPSQAPDGNLFCILDQAFWAVTGFRENRRLMSMGQSRTASNEIELILVCAGKDISSGWTELMAAIRRIRQKYYRCRTLGVVWAPPVESTVGVPRDDTDRTIADVLERIRAEQVQDRDHTDAPVLESCFVLGAPHAVSRRAIENRDITSAASFLISIWIRSSSSSPIRMFVRSNRWSAMYHFGIMRIRFAVPECNQMAVEEWLCEASRILDADRAVRPIEKAGPPTDDLRVRDSRDQEIHEMEGCIEVYLQGVQEALRGLYRGKRLTDPLLGLLPNCIRLLEQVRRDVAQVQAEWQSKLDVERKRLALETWRKLEDTSDSRERTSPQVLRREVEISEPEPTPVGESSRSLISFFMVLASLGVGGAGVYGGSALLIGVGVVTLIVTLLMLLRPSARKPRRPAEVAEPVERPILPEVRSKRRGPVEPVDEKKRDKRVEVALHMVGGFAGSAGDSGDSDPVSRHTGLCRLICQIEGWLREFLLLRDRIRAQARVEPNYGTLFVRDYIATSKGNRTVPTSRTDRAVMVGNRGVGVESDSRIVEDPMVSPEVVDDFLREVLSRGHGAGLDVLTRYAHSCVAVPEDARPEQALEFTEFCKTRADDPLGELLESIGADATVLWHDSAIDEHERRRFLLYGAPWGEQMVERCREVLGPIEVLNEALPGELVFLEIAQGESWCIKEEADR